MPGHGGIGSDGQSNAPCGMTGLHAFGPTATGETPCSKDLAAGPSQHRIWASRETEKGLEASRSYTIYHPVSRCCFPMISRRAVRKDKKRSREARVYPGNPESEWFRICLGCCGCRSLQHGSSLFIKYAKNAGH